MQKLTNHQETICCPECDSKQIGTVQHTNPWYTYLHDCTNCGFTIMESDWELYDHLLNG